MSQPSRASKGLREIHPGACQGNGLVVRPRPEPSTIGSKLNISKLQKSSFGFGPREEGLVRALRERGLIFFPLQFRCLFCLFGFFNFRFSSFCFVSASRGAQIHLETAARLESGSSPSPALLQAAKKVSFEGRKAEPKPAVGENEPGFGTHGKNRPTGGWQRCGLPGRPGECRGRRAPFPPGQIGLLK